MNKELLEQVDKLREELKKIWWPDMSRVEDFESIVQSAYLQGRTDERDSKPL